MTTPAPDDVPPGTPSPVRADPAGSSGAVDAVGSVHVNGSGPSGGPARTGAEGAASGASVDAGAGAHAQPIDVAEVPTPASAVVDRRRYFLSSLEPSGDFDAVIIAVTDGGRRRYFTTRDGARMAEVGHDWFDRRSLDGGRSLLELDERELGELEAELEFVRPVRGRDPIAEAEAETDSGAQAEAEAPAEAETGVEERAESASDAEPEPEAETEPEPDEPEPDEPEPDEPEPEPEVEPEARTEEAEPEEADSVTDEFEAIVLESRRSTFVRAEAVASAPDDGTADQAAQPRTPEPAPEASAQPPLDTAERDALEQVALAKGIAFVAHREQLDRTGAPYIDHPGRIAERFDPATEWVEAAAAWLHDVLEDTPITADELFEAGVRPEVINVVRLLTRTPEVTADAYYAGIRAHEVARRVKLADIDDNTARWRLRRLDYDTQVRLVEKYRVARQALRG